jgi:hypothetical protein
MNIADKSAPTGDSKPLTPGPPPLQEPRPAAKAPIADDAILPPSEPLTLYDLPADRDVIADLRAFRMVKGVARIPETRTSEKGGAKRHGDAGIAAVLARFASRMEIEQYGYEAVRPSNNDSFDDDDTFRNGRDVGGVW